MRKWMIFTIFIFLTLPIFAQESQDLLIQVEHQLQQLSDPNGQFKGITYHLTTNNTFQTHWLIQTPNVWGESINRIAYFPTNCPQCQNDFALPFCQKDHQCRADSPTGRYAHCLSLKAFYSQIFNDQDKKCIGHSDQLIDRMYEKVSQAKHFVDITVLEPFPDIRFLASLRNALAHLAWTNRPVTVRIIEGLYPYGPGASEKNSFLTDKNYLQSLTRDIQKKYPQSQLKIYLASYRSCADIWGGCGNKKIIFTDRFSLNHSKIIAVDGEFLLTGGHNQRTREYLENAPVHDVSLELQGSATRDAHRFADQLWHFVCSNQHQILSQGRIAHALKYESGKITSDCLPKADLPLAISHGKISVMTLGRLGLGFFPQGEMPANQSEIARTLFFQQAKKTIRLSQQDIGLHALGRIEWPEKNMAGNSLEALAKLLLNGGDVYIVLSNFSSIPFSQFLENFIPLRVHQKEIYSLTEYSNNVKLKDVAEKIQQEVAILNATASQPKTIAQINQLLCQHFHLAPLRFSHDQEWDNQYPIANHAKVWIVDDKIFYVGSHNLYPSNLQEFGVVVGDEKITQTLLQDYWSKLWQYSSLAAISGSETKTCYYQNH